MASPRWSYFGRHHGVYSVAHPLRLDYVGLKKRLDGVPDLKKEGSEAGIR